MSNHDENNESTLLDLRALPPGTVCEALGVLTADGKPAGPGPGERFRIEFHDGEVIAVCGDERSWLDRKQPARVVKADAP